MYQSIKIPISIFQWFDEEFYQEEGKKRENKNEKPLSSNEQVEEYMKFLSIMGLQVLQINNKDDMDNPLWGFFHLYLRYIQVNCDVTDRL